MTDYLVDTPEGRHIVRVDGRSIILPDHHSIRTELVLVALGGLPCPCATFALVLEWMSSSSSTSFLSRLSGDIRWDLLFKTDLTDIGEIYRKWLGNRQSECLQIREDEWRSR